ncbi:hypothetical protein T265_03411 [Opisthorchis viverrini]|uniref:Miro-like protein n=1 Tax=Opisthorchis viverrini TaxID=6198 RepID=A0A074ZVX1_OPIVI|nr:hypothetical protein T265_03411 [Opisthorchis viverrini]KER30032.1 hypothetical protein T265_03411 [Opisthorchis viverrini]
MSVFKKLLGLDTQHQDAIESRPDVQPLGPYLQQKFSRGVNYNMKIVIRGDRTSGKTALFNRIKGGEFTETYVATNEIQVASVNWNYKNSGDIIKVEVWDVVDQGKPRPASQGLKLSNSPQSQKTEPCLDASFLDVYKGTHGVIIVMDMTKSWTFTYVRRELPRVPPHLPVLVLASHRDMGDKRTVTEDQVRAFLEEEAECRAASGEFPVSKSPKRAFRVQYCEASMLNGFGLRYVHKFFSLPFLCLQHTVLRQQLARNEMETSHVVAELETDGNAISTNQSAYEAYVQARREKQRVVLTHCSPPESSITTSSNTPAPVCTARGVSVQATALLHQATSDVRRGPTSSTDTAVQHTAHTPNRCSTKKTSCETAPEDTEAFIMVVGDTRAVRSNAARQCGLLDCRRSITNRSDVGSAGLSDDVTSTGDETFAIQLPSSANRPTTKVIHFPCISIQRQQSINKRPWITLTMLPYKVTEILEKESSLSV